MNKCKTRNGDGNMNKTKDLVNIKELNIKVEKEIHHKGKELADIPIPKGFRLLKANEIIFLHNNKKYRKLLNMEDTWEFIEQPFELNKENNYVARFDADSVGAVLDCYGDPRDSYSGLGVRFVPKARQK